MPCIISTITHSFLPTPLAILKPSPLLRPSWPSLRGKYPVELTKVFHLSLTISTEWSSFPSLRSRDLNSPPVKKGWSHEVKRIQLKRWTHLLSSVHFAVKQVPHLPGVDELSDAMIESVLQWECPLYYTPYLCTHTLTTLGEIACLLGLSYRDFMKKRSTRPTLQSMS